ncbi:MAG: endonuclease III [Eubacterium sp.]|jgi:endonuclease-3|nr:endonuclease III [Eubacterium sp.]MCH4047607.1 endonuclease III [Eubacterium sp.]MCH4078379.1 endonuclease III [Eubacterium sp.]MCH4109523.1 endonuclease III [Eubacterium sp.]MCI1306619.1 endonuclease III [Eubacterium sp.]
MEQELVTEILDALEAEYPQAKCALHHENVFQLLTATMLSAQTTDKRVNMITPALFRDYPDAFAMAQADPDTIAGYIRSIGLYRNKSKNLVAMAQMLITDYDGEVPDNMKELVKLPGVGRKTANVVLADGFHQPHIAVDTHVQRVSNRIGLVHEKDVLHTEKSLMKTVPEERWISTHHVLIFHGRNCCTARNPQCETCCIKDLCEHNNL